MIKCTTVYMYVVYMIIQKSIKYYCNFIDYRYNINTPLFTYIHMKTFEQIKKVSEWYAKLMRDNFPQSFECQELNDILINMVFDDEKWHFSKNILQSKLIELKSYVYNKYDNWEKKEPPQINIEVALSSIWYVLKECTSVDDMKFFKKFYDKGELICTLNDTSSMTSRLNSYKIFFIYKTDAELIKKETKPTRDWEYGTSVMCLQFAKGWFLSIKNRYNHKVSNCDNTISNNLDNLIPWLDSSFRSFFWIKEGTQEKTIEIEWYELRNEVFFKKTHEINWVIFWIQKYYKDWQFVIIDKNTEYLIEYILLDLKNHNTKNISWSKDAFFDINFNKITITKDQDYQDSEGELAIIISK